MLNFFLPNGHCSFLGDLQSALAYTHLTAIRPQEISVNIKIIAIGKSKDSHINALMTNYASRMTWTCECIEVIPKKDSPTPRARQIYEAELISKHIPTDTYLIALDSRGKNLSSPHLADCLGRCGETHGKCAFLIGGADGLCYSLLSRANQTLSLGANTWPHMLVRVMLLEQIYRSQQILNNHPYHH